MTTVSVFDKYSVMPALQALNFIDKNYLVLIAFASAEDFSQVWKLTARKCDLFGMKVVRVDTTEANALDFQLSRHPTYILYRMGNEDWMVVGNNQFVEKLDSLRP